MPDRDPPPPADSDSPETEAPQSEVPGAESPDSEGAAAAGRDPEGARWSRRMARYARSSSNMGALGARLAGERFLGLKIDRADHARKLREALGNMRGPLMKVGQLLGTIPEAVPAEYMREFAELQANAPPMGWHFVKRRMQAELGPDWQDRFAEFSREAVHAASLGQVHFARDLVGHPLACKLQYPDMQSAAKADLRQLSVILNLYERYSGAVVTRRIHDELAERIWEELDYDREARHLALYGEMLEGEPDIHVPAFYPELSTDRLLTMSWLSGRPIMEFREADPEIRNRLARLLFRAWYVPFYRYGVLHGDPHLGNYAVTADHGLNLLDFGCMRIFPPRFCQGVIDLYRALQTDDEELAVKAYETWGFTGLSREVIETLDIWARLLYSPVLSEEKKPFNQLNSPTEIRETAARVFERLRAAGGVEIPREFVLMDRSAVGLGSVFLHLDAEVDWHALFDELVEGFDLEATHARQKEALARHGLPTPESPADGAAA